jgi:L-lysine 6-transaminase
MKEAVNKTTRTTVAPDRVLDTIKKHLLVDGFPVVVDLVKSKGARLVDERDGRSWLDFFMFFASTPIGFNHDKMLDDDFVNKLATVAVNKPSNSDFYTTYMAEFMDALDRTAIPSYLPHIFFVSGGALGVENALKAAFDWKVRKNFAKGAKKEIGTQVIHFRRAFHGRTGYTLSLTNTDPVKTDYFPKFNWPRITTPAITFPLDKHLDQVIALENQAKKEIKDAIHERGDDIAALIIEPIQGEGGDNHFRPEFFKFLREITEENEIIFICDEVQSGVGITGKFWAHEHLGVEPDAIAFGKKLQTCGVMASKKFDDVDSVFKVSGRINSTWGGNLVDMVRAARYLEVIEEDHLVENAGVVGDYLVKSMQKVAEKYPDKVTNVRGRGLMAAFDLPEDKRNAFRQEAFKNGLIIVGCGTRSMRFRPPLTLTKAEVDEGMNIIDRSLKAVLG